MPKEMFEPIYLTRKDIKKMIENSKWEVSYGSEKAWKKWDEENRKGLVDK